MGYSNIYFLRAQVMSEISDVGQNVREEMCVYLFPAFERIVTVKREVCFSKFTFLHIFRWVNIQDKTMAICGERRVPEVKGKAMEMRFFLFRVSSIKSFAYKIHLVPYLLRLIGSYPASSK